MVTIRKPKIDEASPQEQIKQIRSYLYNLADELEYALSKIDKSIEDLQKEEK